MPITKSAKRALRKSYKNQKHNQALKNELRLSIKNALVLIEKKDKKSAAVSSKTVSLIDKAVKKKLISKQRAGRLKSKISKTLGENKIKPAKREVEKIESKTKAKKKTTTKAKKSVSKKKVVKKATKKTPKKLAKK